MWSDSSNKTDGWELLLDRGPELSSSSTAQLLQSRLSADSTVKRKPTPVAAAVPRGNRTSEPGIASQRKVSSQAVAAARALVPVQARQKDKFVPLPSRLPEASGDSEDDDEAGEGVPERANAPDGPSRITVYCSAESYDRRQLEQLLRQRYRERAITCYSDVIHLALGPQSCLEPGTAVSSRQADGSEGEWQQRRTAVNENGGSSSSTAGAAPTTSTTVPAADLAQPSFSNNNAAAAFHSTQDVFFFEFGVLITFGLSKEQEAKIMSEIAAKVQRKPYPAGETEVDQFQFVYSATEPPHIKNDMFTINRRQAKNHTVRMAIAHALAQSSKLSVYEERVWDLVEDTKDLPMVLATKGRVPISSKRVAQLIGRVFLQNANVNLLSSVLDTPAFFWSAPDHLKALYERACEYLELEARVEVLNARFQVLQEMLDMLRDHKNNTHGAYMELIIIWLLVVDTLLMFFQLMSLFGVIGR